MSEPCPKCKAEYPDAYPTQYAGGGTVEGSNIKISYYCRKCGARYDVISERKIGKTEWEHRIEVKTDGE